MIDIQKIAREAGYPEAILEFAPKALERFATLIREAVVQELVANQVMPAKEFEGDLWVRAADSHALNAGAVLRERERCAKAVEAEAHMFETLAAAKSCAAAIRSGE